VDLSQVSLIFSLNSGLMEINMQDVQQLAFLNVSLDNGIVDMKKTTANTITTSVSTGSISLSEISSKSVVLLMTAGPVSVQQSTIQILNVTTQRGEVRVNDIKQIQNVTQVVHIHGGMVDIQECDYGNIEVSSQRGRINMVVNSSIFGGNYILKGKSKIRGPVNVTEETDKIRTGFIGNVTKDLNIHAKVETGEIVLNVE